MSILVKYSKIIGRNITVYKNNSNELLNSMAEEIRIDIKDILTEEEELLRKEEEVNIKIEILEKEEEKYEKYFKRAVTTGDSEGASRLLDKKYEAEGKKIELLRKEKGIKENINKLCYMKCKLQDDIKEIEGVLYKVN